MNFNLNTAKAVIANLMVGDYDTDEQKQMHDELRIWALRNLARLSTTTNSWPEIAEIDRWRMFIEILDHIAFRLVETR